MKELFAAFNADFFRALTTLIIPGSIAVSSWIIELVLKFKVLKDLIVGNHVETAFILFIVVIFVGLVIEDMGSRIECYFDRRCDKASGGKHSRDWYAYLKTAFVCEPIGRRYIRTLVMRLKFELGTALGILIADVGLVVLWADGFSTSGLSAALLIVSLAVAAYLGALEAPASHALLATARTQMLDDIRFVKPDPQGTASAPTERK
jgi:hypothetical protein